MNVSRIRKLIRNTVLMLFGLFLCGSIAFVALNAVVFATAEPCDMDFPASFLDKKALLETTDSPRIIIIGDSAVTFGINSERLTETFDRYTINLGIAANISPRFLMDITRPYIQENDIVLLSNSVRQWADTPQYGTVQLNGMRGNYHWFWKIVALDPSLLQYVRTGEQWDSFIHSNIYELKSRLNPESFRPLSVCTDKRRLNFNEHGDFIAWLDRESVGKDYSEYDFSDITVPDFVIDIVNDYAAYLESRGASIYYVPTVMSATAYNNHKDAFDAFNATLQDRLDFPILGSVEAFAFDETYLLDDIFHTTGEGRELYTDQLIAFLQQALDN